MDKYDIAIYAKHQGNYCFTIGGLEAEDEDEAADDALAIVSQDIGGYLGADVLAEQGVYPQPFFNDGDLMAIFEVALQHKHKLAEALVERMELHNYKAGRRGVVPTER